MFQNNLFKNKSVLIYPSSRISSSPSESSSSKFNNDKVDGTDWAGGTKVEATCTRGTVDTNAVDVDNGG